MDKILAWMGEYAYHAFSLILTFLECQFSIILFSRNLERRSYFLGRLVFFSLVSVCFCYAAGVLNTAFSSLSVRVACYLLVTLLNFATTWICYSDSMDNILLAFCGAIAAYQVTSKLLPLIRNFLGINDQETISFFHDASTPIANWEWLLFFGCHILMYGLLSALFRPKGRLNQDKKTRRSVAILSVVTVLTVNVLICISRVHESESFFLNIVVKIFCIMFGLAMLAVSAGIFSENEKEHQIAVLDQLWKQDRAQFESVKASMDIINMKCHDLKHILHRIEEKLEADEVASLQEAIQFYDANIKTGNEVLDVVLCEKAMMCQKNGIRFSCMADGSKLSFLTPVQTYTLFGNIIDNAVEAVRKLDDPEDRVISLTCQVIGNRLIIEESNYFDGQLHLVNGVPETGKADSSRHGYGIKSIRYIAEMYGGQTEISTEENIFFLTVRFPVVACV